MLKGMKTRNVIKAFLFSECFVACIMGTRNSL
jgi:hypothetical protein